MQAGGGKSKKGNKLWSTGDQWNNLYSVEKRDLPLENVTSEARLQRDSDNEFIFLEMCLLLQDYPSCLVLCVTL